MFTIFKSNKKKFLNEAGYAAAQFIWESEDGDSVVPLIVYGNNKERFTKRYEAESYQTALKQAQDELWEIRLKYQFSILVFNATVKIQEEQIDAAIIQASLNSGEFIEVMIPFIFKMSNKGPKIYLPKVLKIEKLDFDKDFAYFLEGIYLHTDGSKYWSKYIDITPW